MVNAAIEAAVARSHEAGFVNGYFWKNAVPRKETLEERGFVHHLVVKDGLQNSPVSNAVNAIVEGEHKLDGNWTFGQTARGYVLAFQSERDAVLVRLLIDV